MSLVTLLLIILLISCIGGLPHWPYSQQWGYGPSGILGAFLIIVLIFYLFGRL